MLPLGPDFYIWAICLLFGVFCVWQACRIVLGLGSSASTVLGNVNAPGPGALELHIGQWLRVATQSPAIAFFALAVVAGVGLPAFYSFLYRPDGPRGYDTVTVYGQFTSSEPNVCFQADAVVSTAAGYSIKLPRQSKSVTFSIEPQNKLPANLLIELDGPGAWYSIDNGTTKPTAIDAQGVVRIPDPIPLVDARAEANLPKQPVNGTQLESLSAILPEKNP